MMSAILRRRIVVAMAGAVACTLCGCSKPEARPAVDPDKEVATLSVCDVLKEIATYQNTMVRVTGIYWYGLRQSCPEPLMIGGRTWPSAIELTDAAASRNRGGRLDFETDRGSWDRLYEFLGNEARAGKKEEIWVSAVGRFEGVQVRANGTVGGFGHMAMLPGELVVQRITDIRVKDRPTYNYGELLPARPARWGIDAAGAVDVD